MDFGLGNIVMEANRRNSKTRMYGDCAIPRGNGQAPFEGFRRLGPSNLHGTDYLEFHD